MTNPSDLEPIDHHLARIEAAGRLMTDLPRCPHCRQAFEPVMAEGSELVCAVEVRHQSGCPFGEEYDDQPAAEYRESDLKFK